MAGADPGWEVTRNWVCLDWATGKVMYEQRWICKGSITYADGFLCCYEERQGTIGLVKASPERFEVISSFKIPKRTAMHWAHPVICGGRLYVRHGNAAFLTGTQNPHRRGGRVRREAEVEVKRGTSFLLLILLLLLLSKPLRE
jgi:hypothetical protein